MPSKFSSLPLFLFAAILLAGSSSPFAAAAPKPIPVPTPAASPAAASCAAGSTVTANVAALDQPYMLNRLGPAMQQGTFLMYSLGASFGLGAEAGQITAGLFGAVTVEPPKAEYYRSQITRADLLLAIDRSKGNNGFTPDGHPILNYSAVYPPTSPRA